MVNKKEKGKQKKDGFISLTNDYAFVQCMKNSKALQGFLASVLGHSIDDIEDIKVRERYLDKSSATGKLGILDVHAYLRDEGDIDIELQMWEYKFWAERTMFYASKLYTSDVEMGQDYDQCEKVIMIQVLGFDYCTDTDYFHSTFSLSEQERHSPYGDVLDIHVIELCKLDNGVKQCDEDIHKWARLISAKSEEERKMIEKDPYIEEALKELEKISNDPKKRDEYDQRDRELRDYVAFMNQAKREGREEGRKEGRKEGREEGRAEERRKMSRLAERLKQEACEQELLDAIGDQEKLEVLYKKYGI